jgi:hypothetical protein
MMGDAFHSDKEFAFRPKLNRRQHRPLLSGSPLLFSSESPIGTRDIRGAADVPHQAHSIAAASNIP